MVLFLFSSLFLILILKILFWFEPYLSLDLHSFCLSQVPQSKTTHLYEALVCGKKLPNSIQKSQLQSLGLIHLFVVSGAHLHLINRFLNILFRNKIPTLIKLFFLFFFVGCCDFQISALRAWIQILFKHLNQSLFLNYTSYQTLLLSVFFALLFQPQQITSCSLILSWGASLCLITFSNTFTQSFYCFLILSPIIESFSSLSPWSILYNIFLTPIIALSLFPLTLISTLFTTLVPICEVSWNLFFKFSAYINQFSYDGNGIKIAANNLTFWFYIFMVHLIFEKLFSKTKR